MAAIIEAENLGKAFGSIRAVQDLSFTVESGEVYGFLGQNGAGKSTTIRMLLTLVRPSSGRIRMFGRELSSGRREVLSRTGAIIEKPDLYPFLSARDNLRLLARLSGRTVTNAQLDRQLEMVGLTVRAGSKVRTFSQGMKQRLGIACALVHGPDLIILDEPTNGLDPQGIADVRNLVLQLSRNEGKTVFISSHLLHEVELVADSMLIIDRGRKVAEGKVRELLHPSDTLVEVHTGDDAAALRLLQQSRWSGHLQEGQDTILLKMHRGAVPELVRFLTEAGIGITALQPRHRLENFFLTLTTANQHVAAYPDRTV